MLDILTASKAKTCWDLVFKLISDSPEFPRDIWFLNVAGVESRLRVHAGKCISSSVSEKENNSTEGQLYLLCMHEVYTNLFYCGVCFSAVCNIGNTTRCVVAT